MEGKVGCTSSLCPATSLGWYRASWIVHRAAERLCQRRRTGNNDMYPGLRFAFLSAAFRACVGVTLHGATFNSPPECIYLLHISSMVNSRFNESKFKSFWEANTTYFNHTNWILRQ